MGAAIDDDAFYANVAVSGKLEDDVIAPSATAHGALVTEDAAVVMTNTSASASPSDPKEGEVLIELWALP